MTSNIQKKRIAIIGTVGLPPNYGGFETLVDNLTKKIGKAFDITVFCQSTLKSNRKSSYNNCSLKYLPFKANGVQSILYDMTAILLSWFKYDSMLILGSPGTVILPLLKIFKNTNTIMNFGSLEWKRDKWSILAKKYLKFSERVGVTNANIVVADNQYLCDYVRDTYNIKPVLLEYGGDNAKRSAITDIMVKKYSFLEKKYDLSISRAQPDNQLHLLLEAYKKIPNRNLVLISNYSKSKYGIELKKKYSNIQNIFLVDAVYEPSEINAIRCSAKIYIHTHSLCGTAPSLVEVMSLGLPIIAYDVPANRYTTENEALYYKSNEDLIKLLYNINDDILDKIGVNMKEIALRRYTWDRIAKKYAQLF